MKSRSTPTGLKLVSLMFGIGATAILFVLEVPLEGVLAAFLPLFGLVADFAIDGLEFILIPALLACCLLSLLVKQDS